MATLGNLGTTSNQTRGAVQDVISNALDAGYYAITCNEDELMWLANALREHNAKVRRETVNILNAPAGDVEEAFENIAGLVEGEAMYRLFDL